MDTYALTGGKIITPFDMLNDYVIEVSGKKISNIFNEKELGTKYPEDTYDRIIDCKGKIISPGFIDIHNHGANSLHYGSIEDSIDQATNFLAKAGVTSFLATIGGPPFSQIIDNVRKIKEIIQKGYSGTRIAGLNFELPYLNPKHGANRGNILPIKREEYEQIVEEASPYIKIMSVAPELEGAIELIRYLRDKGIVAAIAHSEASQDEVNLAILNGAKLITHIFDAFGPPVQTTRGVKPVGIEEHLLTREDLTAEAIADVNGIHVHPIFLKILVKVKGKDKIILITDSVYTAGLPQGEHTMPNGRTLSIRDDVNINTENDDVSGSALTLNRAIRNMVNHTGIPLKDALLMASYNPARLLKIDDAKGALKVGMDADIAVIDNDVNVSMCIIEGEIVFNT